LENEAYGYTKFWSVVKFIGRRSDDENDHLVHEHAAVFDLNSNVTKSNDVDF
jgi:hypothetical protein